MIGSFTIILLPLSAANNGPIVCLSFIMMHAFDESKIDAAFCHCKSMQIQLASFAHSCVVPNLLAAKFIGLKLFGLKQAHVGPPLR